MSREFRFPLEAQDIEQLKEVVWDLFQVGTIFVTSETGDYTTEGKRGWEIVHADATGTGTQTITLSTASAQDLNRVTIKKGGTKTVQADTENTETIDGSATDTVTDVTHYMYSDVKGEWSKL